MQIQWLGEGADYWLWGGSECIISGWWGSECRFRGDGEWGEECMQIYWLGGEGVNADLVAGGGVNADVVAGGME